MNIVCHHITTTKCIELEMREGHPEKNKWMNERESYTRPHYWRIWSIYWSASLKINDWIWQTQLCLQSVAFEIDDAKMRLNTHLVWFWHTKTHNSHIMFKLNQSISIRNFIIFVHKLKWNLLSIPKKIFTDNFEWMIELFVFWIVNKAQKGEKR